jgi:NADH:ubiquinone oxidoreductase subunit 3 (subunit A)/NADH:ubiquinone oxidoreductase subunit 6 (subunit J)
LGKDISKYPVHYIGAIAILFLFVIMMIDIEVVEMKSNNYLPLLLFLLISFIVVLKKILYNLGVVNLEGAKNINLDLNKMKWNNIWENYESQINLFANNENLELFNLRNINSIMINNENINIIKSMYNILKNCSNNPSQLFSMHKGFISSDFYKNSNESILNLNNVEGIENLDSVNSFLNFTLNDNNYLLVIPSWDSALSRMTQISAIGDVLYTVYHSYIYIVSIILLLGMIGAIILTADNNQKIKIVTLSENKVSCFFPYYLVTWIFKSRQLISMIIKNNKINWIKYKDSNNSFNKELENNVIKFKSLKISVTSIPSFLVLLGEENINSISNSHSEDIIGNLLYFLIANILIGILFLLINSYFSLSIKYLEKGGGFECGFTSFVQTRERFNVIFYRVSLLFLVFDLEIILAFPYTALYQKSQNISKNNILAFLYILIVGFIYELKEGALNIIKKVNKTELRLV